MWCCKYILETIGKAQKKMDSALSRGFPLCEILHYDLTRGCPLFDEAGLAIHKKHEILKPLKSDLQEEDCKLNWNDNLKTAVVVDLMSTIREVPISCL